MHDGKYHPMNCSGAGLPWRVLTHPLVLCCLLFLLGTSSPLASVVRFFLLWACTFLLACWLDICLLKRLMNLGDSRNVSGHSARSVQMMSNAREVLPSEEITGLQKGSHVPSSQATGSFPTSMQNVRKRISLTGRSRSVAEQIEAQPPC